MTRVQNLQVVLNISGDRELTETTADYRVIIGDSRKMQELANNSVNLVVTSPPYPMVGIWDDFFREESAESYDEMHSYLSQTWKEVKRVLAPGGLACINIGDATRTKDGMFHLYPNHSRVIETFEHLGLVTLPYILWKKPTTKPRYKGKFTKKERDEWFSQVWSVKGTRQTHGKLERRVAAFPEEIPRRLIRMFSIEDDLVLDPFLGSGTTLKAAMDLSRRFIGYEKLQDFSGIIQERMGHESERIVFRKQSVMEQVGSLLTA